MNINKIIEKIQTADLIECDEVSEYYGGPYNAVVELEDKYYAVKWNFASESEDYSKSPVIELLEYKEVVPIKVIRTEYVIPNRYQEIHYMAGKITQFLVVQDKYLLTEEEFRQNLVKLGLLKDGN